MTIIQKPIKEYIEDKKRNYEQFLEIDLKYRHEAKDTTEIDKCIAATRTRILVYHDLLNKYFK